MGKKTKFSLITLLILSVLIYFLAHNDDQLDNIAAEWTYELNNKINVPSNGHLYALGLQAPDGEDPEQFGKIIQDNYFDYLKTDLTLVNNGPIEIPTKNKLQFPEYENTCRLENSDCLNYFLNKDLKFLENHLESYKTILSRYEKYLNFDTHYYTSPPGLHSPIPKYQYLIAGNQLLLIKNIIFIKKKQTNIVKDVILDDLKKNRRLIENSSNLIEKLIHVAIFKKDIEFLSLLMQNEYIEAPENIAYLTAAELSLFEPFKFEFVMTSSLFPIVSNSHYIFSENFKLPKIISKLIIKKNRSINSSLKNYDFYFNNDSLSPSEYMQARKKELEKQTSKSSLNFKNIVGELLVKIAEPNYSEYKYRLFDVNQKIALFNNYIVDFSYKKNNWNTSLLTSSYDKSKQAEITDSKICLYSPLEKKEKWPCIEIVK